MAHALLSPSAASRWMACAPSARLEAEVEDFGSVYAREGSVAHALSELYANIEHGNIPASEFEARKKQIPDIDEFYNEEMQEHIDEFAEFEQEIYNEALAVCPDPTVLIERKVDLSFVIPEGFGTIDRIFIGEGIMWIIDLKYGKGVPVDAYKNKQLMIYALGAVNELGFLYTVTRVKMFIHQPRIHNFTSYEMTVDELNQWAETELKEKAQLAFEGKGDFVPGNHCGFCKVKGRCRALAEYNLELAEYEKKAFLTNAERAEIFGKLKGLISWADSFGDTMLEDALKGVTFEGLKLVEGRSNRRYVDPDQVATKVLSAGWPESDVYTKKVVPITAMEKLLGKKHTDALIGHLITKPAGKPTLVSETDNRRPYNPAALDFKDLLD